MSEVDTQNLTSSELPDLLEEEYDLRLEIHNVQRMLAEAEDPAADSLLEQLTALQQDLFALEAKISNERASSKQPFSRDAIIQHTVPDTSTSDASTLYRDGGTTGAATRGGSRSTGGETMRGHETTGLQAEIALRMAQIPTATYHLFNPEEHPLVVSTVENSSSRTRRIRVTSYIEGYSANAIDTAEIASGAKIEFIQLPTLFPQSITPVTELTRATLNVILEDLDGQVETHITKPVWMLSRNSAPLGVRDPSTGGWNDLTRYFGAFVTPNEASVMHFQREVARHHPHGQLVGYQVPNVDSQVKAVFDALKHEADITYVNSVIDFSPDQSSTTQRARLPRETLSEKQANCIDGTLLFASLLEGISLNPAIITVPGHAFVGWETRKRLNQWRYLETTKIGSAEFEKAVEIGERRAKAHIKQQIATNNPAAFRRWSLRELRTKYGITPME